MRIFRVHRGDDRGVAAVEFALISVPLLTLIYGGIAFGFTLNAQETATQLAREGARAAAICGPPPATGCDQTAKNRITAATPAGFSVDWSNTTVSTCASGTGDAYVVVETHPPLDFPPFLTSGTAIRGKATTPCGG